jgi:hypothetical protein
VLTVTPAGNGNALPITNLGTLSLAPSTAGQNVLTLDSGASTSLVPIVAQYDVLTLSQAYDATNNRVFQNRFMEVILSNTGATGTHYWVPLYI